MQIVINIPEKVNNRLRSYLGHGYGLRNEDVKIIADAIYNGQTEPNLQPTCNQLATDDISRQAAIDAHYEYCNKHPDAGFPVWSLKILEDLPSAQPEQRWIPVTERLPREYTRVIGYMAWHAMTAVEHQNGRWYSIDHLEPLPDEAVSHWMPLPKPPKEGEE